jgi:hypothetical protein
MDETYSLSDVRAMSSGQPEVFSLDAVRAMQAGDSSLTDTHGRALTNGGAPAAAYKVAEAMGTPEGRAEAVRLGLGALRGASDIGNTLLNGGAWLADKLTPGGAPNLVDANRQREASLNQFFDERIPQGNVSAGVGRLGMNVAGTAGVGPALAAPVRALGGSVPAISALANAIESGGMTTGTNLARTAPVAARVGDMALRVGGGAVTGGASAGLVDPSSAGAGAAVGGALPVVVGALGAAGRAGRNVYRAATMPSDVKMARDIAQIGGADPQNLDQLAQMRDALRQHGPSLIPGAEPTVPQILQQPGISQLQRTVKAANPGVLAARESEQNAARLEALNRIAPVSGTVQQAAEDAGNAIADAVIPARNAEMANVSRLFESVDPFNETSINLPIDEMKAARAKFVGPGTFGSGAAVDQAINTAEGLGTQALPAVQPVRSGKGAGTLLQAVRAAGGINPNSAGGMNREIIELGRKQTGTTGLVNSKGPTIDRLAVSMRERGFIPDEDPATLLNAIRSSLAGEAHYGSDVPENAFRGALERSMGDAPQAASIARPVTFQEVQNLRSSIGEARSAAVRNGNAKEAAALGQMVRDIDARVNAVSQGLGSPGEHFPPDITGTWKEAIAAHKARKLRFDTGPQASIFRTGSDGMPQVQGAEIPAKFFGASRSQVENAQAFRRLVADDPRLMGDLRRYAVTDAAGQVDRLGNLTNAKFNRWLDARSGATGEIFNESQRAILKAVADDLRRADLAESMARSSGSDTAQKVGDMMRLGLLDSPGAGFVASRVPGGRTLLDFVRGPAQAAKAERMAGLLANPERVGGLLDTFIATQQPQGYGLLSAAADPMLYRAAPLLLTGPNR